MEIHEAYNEWAEQYDSNLNKTRDAEAIMLRQIPENTAAERCLEIGCGTGKNTSWLANHFSTVTAVDFSSKMLAKAKEKNIANNVTFIEADITKAWKFEEGKYDLIAISLVLEHIENVSIIFEKALAVMSEHAYIYIGEFHPFKQYTGSKARYEHEATVQELTCFNHHVSDFVDAATKNNLSVEIIQEYFDEDDKNNIPRILAMLFKRK